ncbi:MlaC/ttg2D family ABC transporter substrate-binding protein [Archangium primigenium]|uniref:MlaC/ttg2D family ABC transporter substrate-binding protein n=1 Tax=[Archangium] primigenium TaxID=2792470 RepID=UPI00195B667A|nr:ABC transporter substrate-binding protein [Archangium primigenium]MBM7116283.1 ABC transporter substrate-binding protein [Archangium primigenium]
MDDTTGPEVLLEELTANVLRQIQADPSIQKGDLNAIIKLVNEKILPYGDFERTTRLVMGRNWLKATPTQRAEITEQFKLLLIQTYAGALARVRDPKISYGPLRVPHDATDVVVYAQVLDQGQVAALDYRMAKTPNGWRVYDMNMLGAWLVPAYRQQFGEQIAQHGIDGLLQFLKRRNASLANP